MRAFGTLITFAHGCRILLLVSFAVLVIACQPEAKRSPEKPAPRNADLALLDRLTPRLGKFRLADTAFEDVQLILIDSCASPLLSAALAGWPRGCGAITVEWNYVRPVLLIGHVLAPQHLDAILVPVVPEDGPDSVRYPVKFFRFDRQVGWRLLSTQWTEAKYLVEIQFVDLNNDGTREICLQSGLAMHGDMTQQVCTYVAKNNSLHPAGYLFGSYYKFDHKRRRIQETVGESNYAECQRLYEWRGADLITIREAELNQLDYDPEDATKERWRLDYRELGANDSLRSVYKETYVVGAPRSAAYDRYWENFFRD